MKIIDLCVVVDNLDPYNASRVRAYPLSLFDRLGADPVQIVKDQDKNAKYKPWKQAEKFEDINDPYCYEPFLPKHINIIPKAGDLIKVIMYDNSDSNAPKEYVVVNSTINSLKSETYRTADRFHQNNTKRADLDNTREQVPGYNPSYTDVALSSGKNSDIILNDGRITLKVGHQTQLDTGVKQINLHQGVFNLTQFKTGYTYQDSEVEITKTQRIAVNSILEYSLYDYTNNILTINGEAFKFGLGINIKMLDAPDYTDSIVTTVIDNSDLDLIIYFNDSQKFINSFKKILTQFDKKELDLTFDDSVYTNDNTLNIAYKIYDRRKPVGGVMPNNYINMGQRYYIRQSKSQGILTPEGNTLLVNIGNAINTTGGYVRPKPSGLTKVKSKSITRKLTPTNTPETTAIIGSDNLFFLSWKENDYAKLNTRETITQEMIYNKDGLIDTTEPMVRGNQLLVVITKLIDLILNHGHKDVSDSRGTIDNITIEDLNRIKSTILNLKSIEKQLSVDGKDINDAITNLINHNMRIN